MSVCARGGSWLLRAAVCVVLAVALPTCGGCPRSCVCRNPAEVHCAFKYLTAVPERIPPAAQRLHLGFNSLTVLRENDLSGLGHLELLMLHSNNIHTIEDRAFLDLKSLQVLKMSYNKVKEINKETFKGLESLSRLHMDHNRIEFISPEAFYGLTNLQLVHLEGNQLQQVHSDTFITQRYSQVFKVSLVRSIYLSDNLLTSLPADIFSGCTQLENLFLHGNPWTCDCRMKWFPMFAQSNSGVLKCKQDKNNPRNQLCPVCENPEPNRSRPLARLTSDAFICTKPWIHPHLKQKNISLDDGDFNAVTPKDFIAPLGSIQMNLTDQFHNDASISCTVQRPSAFENMTLTVEEEVGGNVTILTSSLITSLVCNVDHEHIQQLWRILATYSDSPMRLERGLMLARTPEMVYRYSQIKPLDGQEGIHTDIVSQIKASPAWLMQGKINLQLDRTTTTFSTLHIKYWSVVNLRVENTTPKRGHYAWTMIKRDNKTKTEHTVLTGGVVQLNCQILGEPKPLVEWILPDGSKVRAPFSTEDRRIIITAEGKLTLRGADTSDTGLYRCIATNYLDADILSFRVTVVSHDVEEAEVNGVQLSLPLDENVVFDCGSTGSPDPLVQWILPDHSVLDKSHGNRKVYKNGTLVIQGLTERDRGFYRCVVVNQLGVDLLVSHITVTGERSKMTALKNEGSGMEMEFKVEPSLADNKVTFNEIPSSSSTEGTTQESRTITSDRPYPRLRSRGRGGRLGHRGRGFGSSRRTWSSRRVFDKTSRKVDPEKFAELLKKAQNGSRIKTGAEKVKYDDSDTDLSGDGEIGSGGDYIEAQPNIRPTIVKPTTENPQEATITWQDNKQTETLTTTQTSTGTHQAIFMETTDTIQISLSQATKNTNILTTESNLPTTQPDATSVKSTVAHNPTIRSESQSDAGTPSDHTLSPSVHESTEFWALERTTQPFSNSHPVTLQLTVTDTSQETQLQFSGDLPAEPETSTGATLSFVTDPNVTPMMDGPGPVEPIVHTATDPQSQTTFTAVTTTERQQDEITFHTTQRIKSPHLPAGSTIVSRQQIHIIPRKNGRGGGRRRTFQGHRRIIKPNRITDIHSFINKLKPPTLKKEGNVIVPYTVEITTDCDCDENKKKTATGHLQVVTPTVSSNAILRRTERPVAAQDTEATTSNSHITLNVPFTHTQSKTEMSSGYITSADAPEIDPTLDPYMTKKEDLLISTKTTTTTPSKVIRGRIPWNRLFGGRRRGNNLNRIRKPFIPTTTPTIAEITTVTLTTTPTAPTTLTSLAEPETRPPTRHIESTESSVDHNYGDLMSADLEFTTQGPSFHDQTTASPYYHSRSSTTAETPPESQTIPPPPTVKPPSRAKADEALSSGSGSFVFRQRPGFTRGRSGRRRRPFRGRRPFKKPSIAKLNPTTTADALTTEVTTMNVAMETTMRTTTPPQWTVSVSKPLYTPSRKSDRPAITVSTDQTSDDTEPNEEDEWHKFTFRSSLPHTTTNTPLITSTTFNPTTTFVPTTTKLAYTTPQNRVHSNIRPPTQRNNGHTTRRPLSRRVRPTVQSVVTGCSEKPLRFDTTTIFTAEQEYTRTLVPYSEDTYNTISGVYDHITGNEATSPNIVGFDPSTKAMPNKPKIVGGNAASFTVLSSSDAFLPCEAVGNPQPVITWKRFSSSTGSSITIKGKMGKFEVLSNGTLSIQNANIKDRGQYICLAENDQGSDKLLVTLSVVAYPSRILEPKVREIKSHAGNTVEMKCKAEGRPTPTISWILANRTQVRGHDKDTGRVAVNPEGTLVIQQVSVYDRGHYKCIASNPAGADTATVRLQVVAAPPGILEEKRQHMRASVSQNLWLPCTGHGSPQPTVHWVLHDGSVISNMPAGDTRVSAYKNGTLYIKDVTQKDSGIYECIATSSTGSERRVVTVTVEKQESPPQIVETSQRMTELSYGDQLRLTCSATGDPKPGIIWRLPSKAVVDQLHRMGSRIQVLDNGTLVINTVSDKDAGEYLCVARSKIGDDLQLMRVSVSMKPAKIEPKVYSKKWVPFGNDLKVDCKASGAPKPEISWGLPDGTVVNSNLQSDSSSGGGRARRYVLFDNGTLYVNKVGISEEGDYTCYAENQMGKDEMHVHITVVTAAPRIRPPSQTHARVKPGGNVLFDCEALGEPKPKILWMLPTNDIIAASNERYLMHVNGSLDIRDVKLVDTGEYVCMARNLAGENRKVYKLDIDGNPPIINGYRQNRTVIKEIAAKYSRIFIDCKAEGDPAPTVTWIMPDNIFLTAPYFGSRINVHLNGTLEIRNVRPTDTAEFICIARNNGGEAVMVVQLEVTSMLRRPIFKNPFNERVIARTGRNTVLNCSADGHPVPEIIWILPNGSRFTGGPNRGSRHHLGNDGTLVIYSPRREDAGKYRCGAKNFMGYIEKLIVLEVGQKPYILTRPRGIIRSVSGEPLFLHCLSDGSPRPKIYWTIPGGHTLTRPQVLGRYQLLDNGTLIVHDTTLHDRGNYVCRARSDAGEAVVNVPVVIIAYPPRITTAPPPSVRAVAGAPLHLNCVAMGIPKPEITWELPDASVLSTAGQGRPLGSELLHPQGTLIIQRPTTLDSGTYKCLAKNHLGTDSKVTYVRVM